GSRSRGNKPIIAGAIIAGVEVYLNAALERDPAVVRRGYFDFDFSHTVPTSQLRMFSLINAGESGLECDHARGLVHIINLNQRARLRQSRLYPQLNAVIDDFDPLAVGAAEIVVGPRVAECALLPADLFNRSNARAVVARTFEGGCAECAGVVNLDAVELILQSLVTGRRRNEARVVGGRGRLGARVKRRISRHDEGIPLGELGFAIGRGLVGPNRQNL